MKRYTSLFAVASSLLLLGGCAASQQKPPDCKGDYSRINALEKYPATEASSTPATLSNKKG